MIVPLTARLIALPEQAWPRLSAACDSGEPLPSPIAQASAVAGISVASTTLGAIIAPGRSAASVVLGLALGTLGYVGSAATATFVAPRLLERQAAELSTMIPRYSATACLPIAASGMFNFVPLWGVTVVWMLAGFALTARSGWIGAADMLGLEGEARRRAAAVVTAAGGAPVLLSTLLRMLM